MTSSNFHPVAASPLYQTKSSSIPSLAASDYTTTNTKTSYASPNLLSSMTGQLLSISYQNRHSYPPQRYFALSRSLGPSPTGYLRLIGHFLVMNYFPGLNVDE